MGARAILSILVCLGATTACRAERTTAGGESEELGTGATGGEEDESSSTSGCEAEPLPAPVCGESCPEGWCCAECTGPRCRELDSGSAIASCSPDGSCVDLTPCESACVPTTGVPTAGEGAVCVEDVTDCDTIAQLYQERRPPPTDAPPMCSEEADCHVVREHCMEGLGGCWSWGSSIYSQWLGALAQRWRELGCPSAPTCDECDPPETHCELGSDANYCGLD